MTPQDAMGETYEAVELFGKPALFSMNRINRETVPAGLYAYDIRHTGDGSRAEAVELSVWVRHMGTVILPQPLDLGENGFIELTELNGGLNFSAEHGCGSIAAFQKYLWDASPNKAVFLRKARDVYELVDAADHQDEKQAFRVVKTIMLAPDLYDAFKEHLLFDWDFVRQNTSLVFNTDTEIWDCALACAPGRGGGICFSPEGNEYARYAAYIPDRGALDIGSVPIEHCPPGTAVAEIQRLINTRGDELGVTQTQKLLCGIGGILEGVGSDNDQYYLFSHTLGGFAGFCGEGTGVSDVHGKPLSIGDMTCLNGDPEKPQVVFRHPTGEVFPPAEYVEQAGVTRLSPWQDAMLFLRSRDFEVFSCRDDYRMSRQLAPRRREGTRNRGPGGR